jgi:hypothetical protein
MRRYFACLGTVGFCLTERLPAQMAPAPPSVPLLAQLIGRWTMTGTVRARRVRYRLEGGWVLQRRYVELHMEDLEHMPPRYEARVFIGSDTLPGHIVGHWLDNRTTDSWTMRLDAANGTGGWKSFADYRAVRR